MSFLPNIKEFHGMPDSVCPEWVRKRRKRNRDRLKKYRGEYPEVVTICQTNRHSLWKGETFVYTEDYDDV